MAMGPAVRPFRDTRRLRRITLVCRVRRVLGTSRANRSRRWVAGSGLGCRLELYVGLVPVLVRRGAILAAMRRLPHSSAQCSRSKRPFRQAGLLPDMAVLLLRRAGVDGRPMDLLARHTTMALRRACE